MMGNEKMASLFTSQGAGIQLLSLLLLLLSEATPPQLNELDQLHNARELGRLQGLKMAASLIDVEWPVITRSAVLVHS